MLVAFVAVEKTSFSYDSLFCYVVPEDLILDISVGSFVVVPFGKSDKKRQGVVFELEDKEDVFNLKFILQVISKYNFLTKELLDVAKYMHSNYFCSWFETVRSILPNGFFYSLNSIYKIQDVEIDLLNEYEKEFYFYLKQIKNKKDFNKKINEFCFNKDKKKLVDSLLEKKVLVKEEKAKRKIVNRDVLMVKAKVSYSEKFKLTEKQRKLFKYIEKEGEISLKKACYVCGVTSVVAKNLFKLGLVEIFEKHIYKNPYKDVRKTRDVTEIILNSEQKAAKNGILKFIEEKKFKACLLKGVTGSGKTQVFLKLIDFVIQKDKECIFLVPEISLTAQLISYFQSFFGEKVAVLHSGLSLGQQMDEYLRIFNGDAKLIVGTRSAVFAPCKNLGLIVMDEEDGSCYKNSDMSPRYHARDIAKFRCFKNSCVLVFSSATPLVETNYSALNGRYEKFILSKRYGVSNLPKVFVVNLNKAKMSKIPLISQYLYDGILKNLERKEQTILFLNRRGYNLNVFCLDCKEPVKCFNCSALMVFHKVNGCFICHHCGFIKKDVRTCSFCKSDRLVYCGQGTQHIEENIKKNIENIKILRLDADSTFSREEFELKIKMFAKGEYDLLLGTQLVAKGFNFLNVTLVGVVLIDGILFGADFKSHERAFSLLTQVVGRSGRSKKKGRAIIQTFNPENKIISWAAKQNYDLFYKNEILERKEFLCPPFCDIYIINFSGKDRNKLLICAKEFIEECRKNATKDLPFIILGISTPYIEMLNKRFRKRILIKCKNTKQFRNWMRRISTRVFSSRNFLNVRTNIDINGDIL